MEEYFYKRRHVPAFGNWDCNENLPFTQCFHLCEYDVVTPAMIAVPRTREYFYKRRHVPAFGGWDCNENLPFTQCFDSVRQAGLLRYSYSGSEDRDLYVTGDLCEYDVVTPAMISVPRTRANVRDQKEKEAKRQNYITDMNEALNPTATTLPMPTINPVDEDLYNISPQLFMKTKKRRALSFFSNCLLPNCIA